MITIFASGYIGADAELSATPKGKEVANFRLGSRNRAGETDWVRCSLWGDRAPKLCPHLKKGTYVVITGSPGVEAWHDQSGEIKSRLQIQVTDLDFGPKRDKPDAGTPGADIADGESAGVENLATA